MKVTDTNCGSYPLNCPQKPREDIGETRDQKRIRTIQIMTLLKPVKII